MERLEDRRESGEDRPAELQFRSGPGWLCRNRTSLHPQISVSSLHKIGACDVFPI